MTLAWPGVEHGQAGLLNVAAGEVSSATGECASSSLQQQTTPDPMKQKNWLSAGFICFQGVGNNTGSFHAMKL